MPHGAVAEGVMTTKREFRAGACAALLAALLPGAAAAACVAVPVTENRVAVPGTGPILDVRAAGRWTAEAGAPRRVGPGGHPGGAAPDGAALIAPPCGLGALIVANAARRVWDHESLRRGALGALLAGAPLEPGPLRARIDDAPGGLGGNAGAVTLGIERAGG
jgi:hypothetical protein